MNVVCAIPGTKELPDIFAGDKRDEWDSRWLQISEIDEIPVFFVFIALFVSYSSTQWLFAVSAKIGVKAKPAGLCTAVIVRRSPGLKGHYKNCSWSYGPWSCNSGT